MILKRIRNISLAIISLLAAITVPAQAFAEEYHGISMSPLNQIIALTPGEEYSGKFTIKNAYGNTQEFPYTVEVKPFYVDNDYNIYYESTENFNQLVDWITLSTTEGVLPVNGEQKIEFKVNVPTNAPAGGQYAAIVVSSVPSNEKESEGIGITFNQNIAMAHILYAEIAGTTKRQGEILSTNVQGFLFDGNIKGTSTIKNTGNIHGTAKYKLQVFPLFSNEEIFTNEENPDSMVILPDRSYYNETTWDNTPPVGVFNVVYTVEFEGVTAQVKKMVIKCPVWLLFLIVFVIAAIIIYFIVKAKTRKTRKSQPAATTE